EATLADRREAQPGPVVPPSPPAATAPLEKQKPGARGSSEPSYAASSAPKAGADIDAMERAQRADSSSKDAAAPPSAAGPAAKQEAAAPSVARPSAEEPSSSAYRSEGKIAEANKESREKTAAAAPTPPASAGGRAGATVSEEAARTLAAPGPTAAQRQAASVVLPPDVAGRLAVSDRPAAQRALAELLHRLGGTEVSHRREPGGIEVVEFRVPRDAYAALTEGLRRLGHWVPERERADLPPDVRVGVRITEP
ncbi:MAG: hypothetical protein ACRELA_15400, partial [Candidatus Rokuibacteriota bacterium]